MSRFATLIVVLGSMMLLVGCQNMNGGGGESAAGADKGVVCVGSQGSVVVLPDRSGQVKVLTTAGSGMACEQCKKDAAGHLTAGKPIVTRCAACGATRYPVAGMH